MALTFLALFNMIATPILILSVISLRRERRLQAQLLDESLTAISLFRIHRGR